MPLCCPSRPSYVPGLTPRRSGCAIGWPGADLQIREVSRTVPRTLSDSARAIVAPLRLRAGTAGVRSLPKLGPQAHSAVTDEADHSWLLPQTPPNSGRCIPSNYRAYVVPRVSAQCSSEPGSAVPVAAQVCRVSAAAAR